MLAKTKKSVDTVTRETLQIKGLQTHGVTHGVTHVTNVTKMYNRLFTKILDSSIWLEADSTRLVWITLLASMDEDGYCAFSSIENLARRANIPLDETKQAVLVLESPDKFNKHDEFEGRRIEHVVNGWVVLKAPYYRTLLSREIVREQTRLRVAKHREKQRDVTNETLQDVTSVPVTNVTIAKQSKAVQIEETSLRSVSSPPTQTVVWSKDDNFQGISSEIVERWKTAYPACDIERQLAAMHEWLLSNPEKAVRKNWLRFITRWLAKSQDRGGDLFGRAHQRKESDPNKTRVDAAFERAEQKREELLKNAKRPNSADG